jgi:hypothetical protein
MAADGVANEVITDEVGVTPVTVRAWRKQFVVDGLAGLGKIGEGRGRKPSISERRSPTSSDWPRRRRRPGHALVVPRDGRAGGGQSGDGATDLIGSGFAAHRVDTFEVSNDAKFEDKLVDVTVASWTEFETRPTERSVEYDSDGIARAI